MTQRDRALSAVAGSATVIWASFAILVTEIVATRMLAPYVGVTLETLSAVIGCALAGISVGNWVGGRVADRIRPRRTVGPALVIGGLLLTLAPLVIRTLGDHAASSDPWSAVIMSLAAFFLPCMMLSTISPMVIKDLGERSGRLGAVAGGISALATAGALAGNFTAGFFLVGTFRTSQILILAGIVSIILGGILIAFLGSTRRSTVFALPVFLLALGTPFLDAALPCLAETEYACLNIDRIGPSGLMIRNNIYTQSYTDVANPRQLMFSYTRDIAAAVAPSFPNRPPSNFLYIGGGGYTLPLYFREAYPTSRHNVLEIDKIQDQEVRKALNVDLDAKEIATDIGDARVKIRQLGAGTYDVVVGDAFAGISVPWHLTTKEFLESVRRSLATDGVYVMNLIDYDHYDLARAELRTFLEVFGEVAVISSPEAFSDGSGAGHNFILVGASHLPEPSSLSAAIKASTGSDVVTGNAARSFMERHKVITDALAPTDQLLGRP